MRALWLAVTFFAATCAQAGGLNKCSDAFGRMTYTSETCEKEGLTPAGAIRDRVTILPTSNTVHPTRRQAPKKDDERSLPAVKPVNPLVADQLTK